MPQVSEKSIRVTPYSQALFDFAGTETFVEQNLGVKHPADMICEGADNGVLS